MKHAFSSEQSAPLDPVQPTDQALILPDFYAVGVSEPMQVKVGVDHLRQDPGPFSSPLPTRLNHCRKIPIEGDRKALLADQSLHAARHMQVHDVDHGTGVGAPPQRRQPLVIPGEYSAVIGREEPLRRKRATDRDQASRIGETRIGKLRA